MQKGNKSTERFPYTYLFLLKCCKEEPQWQILKWTYHFLTVSDSIKKVPLPKQDQQFHSSFSTEDDPPYSHAPFRSFAEAQTLVPTYLTFTRSSTFHYFSFFNIQFTCGFLFLSSIRMVYSFF